MFDLLPDLASLSAADDATVVAAIEGWARAESASAARRLAAIAELMDRRCRQEGQDDGEVDPRDLWACDNWDSAAAEVAAALGTSHRRASNQMHQARALRERLPRTAALLADGAISAPTASTITWRTHLVEDDHALAAIDTAIATSASEWGPLSDSMLKHSIDAVLDEHEPDALTPIPRCRPQSRHPIRQTRRGHRHRLGLGSALQHRRHPARSPPHRHHPHPVPRRPSYYWRAPLRCGGRLGRRRRQPGLPVRHTRLPQYLSPIPSRYRRHPRHRRPGRR